MAVRRRAPRNDDQGQAFDYEDMTMGGGTRDEQGLSGNQPGAGADNSFSNPGGGYTDEFGNEVPVWGGPNYPTPFVDYTPQEIAGNTETPSQVFAPHQPTSFAPPAPSYQDPSQGGGEMIDSGPMDNLSSMLPEGVEAQPAPMPPFEPQVGPMPPSIEQPPPSGTVPHMPMPGNANPMPSVSANPRGPNGHWAGSLPAMPPSSSPGSGGVGGPVRQSASPVNLYSGGNPGGGLIGRGTGLTGGGIGMPGGRSGGPSPTEEMLALLQSLLSGG